MQSNTFHTVRLSAKSGGAATGKSGPFTCGVYKVFKNDLAFLKPAQHEIPGINTRGHSGFGSRAHH